MAPTTNVFRTDEETKIAVANELRWDSRIDASKVSVEVNDGIILLTGTVPSYGALIAAGTDAWKITGVQGVDNQLTVRLPDVPPIPSDSTIQSNAERTLEWNPDIDAVNIRVFVNEGLITLTGTVPTHWEKTKSEELAGTLAGVISVKNELAVVPTEDVPDEIVAEEIVDALNRSVLVESEKIDVTVNRGIVTLKGTVPTAAVRLAAYRTASHTAGVVSVEDDLIVGP